MNCSKALHTNQTIALLMEGNPAIVSTGVPTQLLGSIHWVGLATRAGLGNVLDSAAMRV